MLRPDNGVWRVIFMGLEVYRTESILDPDTTRALTATTTLSTTSTTRALLLRG